MPTVLPTIASVMLVLWVIAVVTGTMFGGLAHGLLAVAAVIFIIRASQGQSPLRRG